MPRLDRRHFVAALLAAAGLAASSPSHALSMRGPGGRPGGPRPIDPDIGNGRSAGWSRRTVAGGHGTGPDPQPTRRWRNPQGGLLGGLDQPGGYNPSPAPYGGPYHCHPRRRRMGLCG